MSTKLQKVNGEVKALRMADLSPEYAEIMVLGNVLFQSGYFKDVRDQAQAVTKILCGRELGFSPIVSLQGIHIIEGKPALSSNLMATLIKRSGKYDYRVKNWTHQECTLTFREAVRGKWEEVGESSFTMDDAKAAGVVRQGGSWTKYPKPMLFARALSQGMRTYCPDVSASPIYVPEEMGAEVNGEGDVVTLPKSARPVERITEEIPLDKPKSAAVNKDQGETTKAKEGKSLPTSPEAAEKDSTGVATPLRTEGAAATPGTSAVTEAPNERGEPSTKVIPASKWPAAKMQAVAWLKANQ